MNTLWKMSNITEKVAILSGLPKHIAVRYLFNEYKDRSYLNIYP